MQVQNVTRDMIDVLANQIPHVVDQHSAQCDLLATHRVRPAQIARVGKISAGRNEPSGDAVAHEIRRFDRGVDVDVEIKHAT